MKDLGCHGRGLDVSAISAGDTSRLRPRRGVVDPRGLILLERALHSDVLAPVSIFVTHFRINSQPPRTNASSLKDRFQRG